jgi:hypothetical protein
MEFVRGSSAITYFTSVATNTETFVTGLHPNTGTQSHWRLNKLANESIVQNLMEKNLGRL